MTLPVNVKTWQLSINQTVLAQGSVAATEKRILRTIKNLFIGFALMPWTVQGSSNSLIGAMDAVDRWTVDGDLVKAAGAHSWIVLRQTGIATNYELCIDLNNAGNNVATIVISPAAGFTGGTNAARPTATDEISMITTSTIFSGVDTTHQIHAMQSTDGQCTRLAVWRGTTNLCMFWLLDRPANPTAGWINPSVTFVRGIAAGLGNSYAELTVTVPSKGRNTTTFDLLWTGEGGSATNPFLATTTNIGTIPNDIDGAWPFFPIGIFSTTLAHKGRHGSLFDIWWRPISVADADTFPNNAAARQFVAFGNLILPWTGGADVPLII